MKTAVVLFNLGGPDSLGKVRGFLFNLFNDAAIIRVPQPLRFLLAAYISLKRTGHAKAIYRQMDGRSPLLEHTRKQALALEQSLAAKGNYKVFVSMRYSEPSARETVQDVKDYEPSRVILLPLYPQYSTTTTKSSLDSWYNAAAKAGLKVPHHPICCYPSDTNFIDAHAELIKEAYDKACAHGSPRILFSAHGLPKKIVDKGDPYVWQIGRSVSAIMRKLGAIDHAICFQSKVGKLEWTSPSTEEELLRAGKDDVPVVVVPIAFVSEHSETLVELDIDYRAFARQHRVPHYERVPALNTQPHFIETLTWMCEATKFYPNCSNSLGRICPKESTKCGFKEWG